MISSAPMPTDPAVILSIIEGALGRATQAFGVDANQRVAYFDIEEEVYTAQAWLCQNYINALVGPREGSGWTLLIDVSAAPPLVTQSLLNTTLRFPAAQFIPGGPRRLVLTSEPAQHDAIFPELIFWACARDLRVTLVEAVVEQRSLLDAPHRVQESMVILDVGHASDVRRFCVRAGEHVHVILEAPDLDAATMAGAFHVDLQLEGSRVELPPGDRPIAGLGGARHGRLTPAVARRV